MGLNIALLLLQFGAWSCNGDFARYGSGLIQQGPWNHRLYHHSQRQEQWPQEGDSDVTTFRNPHPSVYHYQLQPQPPNLPPYNHLPTPPRFQENLPHYGLRPQAQAQTQRGRRPTQRHPPSPRPPQAEKTPPPQAASGQCGLVVVNQIIKGNIATRGLFPWQVAMFYKFRGVGTERMACSGALIHPKFVLTAAHCLDLRDTKGHVLSGLLLGATDLRARDNHTRFYVPDQVTCNADYRRKGEKGERNPADICVLRLPESAPYTDFIRPVCLPRATVPTDLGSQSLVFRTAGWGGKDTTFNPEFSEVLLWVKLPSVNAGECSKQLDRFVNAEKQVCAGGLEEDTCKGDSGAGLVGIAPMATSQNENVFEVVGVLSYGTDLCGQKKPAVFTRVDAFLPWIQDIIRSG